MNKDRPKGSKGGMPEDGVIVIYCGECGVKMRLDVATAGKKIRCKQCKATLPVPSSHLDRPQMRLFCPKCRGRVRAWTEQAGETLQCPKCKGEIELPELEAEKGADADEKKGDTRPVTPTEPTEPAAYATSTQTPDCRPCDG